MFVVEFKLNTEQLTPGLCKARYLWVVQVLKKNKHTEGAEEDLKSVLVVDEWASSEAWRGCVMFQTHKPSDVSESTGRCI